MSVAETMDFRTFGQPDWSEVGKFFHLLPAEFRNRLNRSETEVLKWIVFYVWHSQLRAGRAIAYGSFSQEKVGEKFGRSRWTVLRALAKLDALGLIRRVRRRPKAGKVWQTNLTMLTAKLLRTLSACLHRKKPKIPCSKIAPQVFPKILKTTGSLPPSGERARQEEIPEVTDNARAMVARFFRRTSGTLSL